MPRLSQEELFAKIDELIGEPEETPEQKEERHRRIAQESDKKARRKKALGRP